MILSDVSINVEMGFVRCFWGHDVITHFSISEPGKSSEKAQMNREGKQ